MRIRFSFDTNILIYAADVRAGDKHHLARDMVRRAVRDRRGAIGEQNVMEFLYAASRKLPISFNEAVDYVTNLLAVFDLLLAKSDVIDRTLQLVARYRLSIWDARMVAVCAEHDCVVLFSEDMQDRGHYGGVRVINPLRGANREIVEEVLNS
jgi:predicted nucleic acid-binding protein